MCPVRERSNNKILPANARASDVAEKAVNEIIPVQQRRYYDAFRVQGIVCVHYSNLLTGRKCSCKSSQKQLNGRLDKDGKASIGDINSLLTGNMSFTVTPYDQDKEPRFGPNSIETSPLAPVNKNQGVFDIATFDPDIDFPFADIVDQPAFGDNGPVNPVTIDELAGDFDAGVTGFFDTSCPVCFGTGFIGGYSPYHAHRWVTTVADVQLVNGELDLLQKPWVASCDSFNTIVTLPRGAINVDAFKVWNSTKQVASTFTIDGTVIASIPQLLAFCDGHKHLLQATVNGPFTHFEMQFKLSTESVYFEFPKRSSSSNTALLEQMDPFQIIMSPNLPMMESLDIITESQLGKTLIVQNVNPWQSRNRNMLGWECQVRVIQPMEIYRLLPKRDRVMTKDATTEMVRDNVTGPRRT